MRAGPDPPVSEAMLGPLLEAAGEVLASLEAVDVPLAIRHLHGADRRGLAYGQAPRQLRRAIETDERFREQVVARFLSRDEVRAVLSSWTAARAVEEAEVAIARDDLPLLVSALCAARPEGFSYGVGAAAAVAASARRQWGVGVAMRDLSERVAEADAARRRAESDATVMTAEVERAEVLLRDERRRRRALEEEAESSADAARVRGEELELRLRAALEALERAEARCRREAGRCRELQAELRAGREVPVLSGGVLETASAGPAPPVGMPARAEPLAGRIAVAPAPGVVAGSAEEVRALVLDPGAVLVVDGYDLAQRAWPDSTPSDQRARLAMALVRAHRRGWCAATVVFDGAGAQAVPSLRRPGLQVVFSAGGEMPGSVIAREVERLLTGATVLVASSDGAVMAHAEASGARVASADALLEALDG